MTDAQVNVAGVGATSGTMAGKLYPHVVCPKHGTHRHAISSDIKGHEGCWCQLCWLESLGPSMQLLMLPEGGGHA